MIVRTSQDATAVNCGCCQPAECEEPRKKCQSLDVSITLCGTHVTVPPFGDLWDPISCGPENTYYQTLTDHLVISKTGMTTYERTITNNWSIADGECDYSTTDTYDPEAIIPGQGSISTTTTPSQGGNYFFSYVETGSQETGEGTITYTLTETYTFSNPIEDTFSWLRTEALSQIEDMTWDDSFGADCYSRIIPSDFTNCDEIDPARPNSMDVIKARYQIGIPNGDRWNATTDEWIAWDASDHSEPEPLKTSFDVAHAAWVTAHAAWVSADPETRGPEPIEPTQRSVFECQWDEVFFPAEWEAWKLLYDAYVDAVNAYSAWVAAGSVGTPPTVPDDPGAAPTPAPSLVASRSWTYGGTDEFSSWFEIDIPEVVGETRVVNMMVKCFRSSRLGLKPTAHGEVYVL